MPKPIEIVAIEGRTAEGNGVSRPFRCLGEDDARYFVKLKNAGYTQLVKEWIAGRLAQEMGLQAAEIRQVRVPKELVAGNEEFERELGDGIAFGSRRVEPAKRLAMAFVREDPHGLLSRILLFDWWIRNCDRALTETGGNPNLPWELSPGRVVVFDHDNAFDEEFDSANFWQFHALRGHLSAWNPGKRAEMVGWLATGETCIDRLWAELPEEWLVNSYGDPRCALDKAAIKTVLSSYQTDLDFWSLTTSTAP